MGGSVKKKVLRKVPQAQVERKLAAIMGLSLGDEASEATGPSVNADGTTELSTATALRRRGFLSHVKEPKKTATVKSITKKKLDIVKGDVVKETVEVPLNPVEETDTKEKQGMKMLRQTVRNQSHLREMKHHERHDYEYRLRRVATAGVVRLFNALAQAQKAGQKEIEAAEMKITQDKAEDHKLAATRDTFLSTLRNSRAPGM